MSGPPHAPSGADVHGRVLLAATVAAFVVAVWWRFATFGGFSNDHYVHVARGYQMLGGAWPVRDFEDPGMPLTYLLSAAGRALFGNRLLSEFVVMALGFGLGAAATAWATLRLSGSALLTAAAVALEILISPRTYSYPKMLVYGVACVVLVQLAGQPTRRRLALTGVLIALAFLVRHDHGLYLAVACAAVLIVGAGRTVGRAAAHLGLVAAVAALCVAPWAIAVQRFDGLGPYFRAGVAFSQREAEVSLLRAWPRFDLAGAILSDGNASAWLYYLAYALPATCAVLAWRRAARGATAWHGEAAAITGLAVLALAVDRGFLRDPLAARLPDVTVPLAVLGAWLLATLWQRPSRTLAGVACGALLVVPTGAAVWRTGDVHSHLDDAGLLDGPEAVLSNMSDTAAELRRRQRDVERTPTRVSAVLVPFFRYVERCTLPAHRLLVTGAYADVFIAADRGFAGGLVSYQEGFYSSEADQRRALARLEREAVPFAVRTGAAETVFTRDFPLVAAWVNSRYAPLTEVADPQEEDIRVLVSRTMMPTGTDLDTGWPCFK